MSDIVIASRICRKSYLVGHQAAERERYTALRDVIAREARNFARKARRLWRAAGRSFRATRSRNSGR